MSEEQILAALGMQSFLFDEVFKKLSKESSGRRKSVRCPRRVRGPPCTRRHAQTHAAHAQTRGARAFILGEVHSHSRPSAAATTAAHCLALGSLVRPD